MFAQHTRRLLMFLGLLPSLAVTFSGRVAAGEGPGKPPREPELTAEDRAHWAFQRPRRPVVPHPRDTAWVRTPVDAFVLGRLEENGLHPAPAADRATLLRRVTFDLTGLPPTPEELDVFLRDTRPDAYARLVERLLASPHYGEHWAQHWLDVVRYAESNGYETDGERPHAWRYRDYVIRAFNDDKPFDRFLTEQLAGDQLARGKDPRETRDLLIATGFNRCGPVHLVSGNTDPELNRQEVLTEMTTSVGAAFLGLTLACARCHDHKFDPISQADYYRVQALFAAAQPLDVDISTPAEKAAYDHQTQALKAEMEPLRKKLAALEEPYKTLLTQLKTASLEEKYRSALEVPPAQRTAEQQKLAADAGPLIKVTWDEVVDALAPEERAQRAAWRDQLHALEARLPPPPAHAWAIRDEARLPPTYVLKRGNPKQPGAEVRPRFPRILVDEKEVDSTERLSRLDLARWLTDGQHPLTARVLVNRIWQHHFGRGLVSTPNDFGFRGARPSHPALCDWLACELVSHGWSVKHIHRLLVLSNTYQQASRVETNALARRLDPDNRWLWRMNRRRLQGEALRDSVLAVAGTLNPQLGGPMVRVPLEPEVSELIFTEGEPDGVWRVTPDRRQHTRRSIYLFVKRNLRLPLLEVFDRPDTLTSCPVRPVSTFAPQALVMLNGAFIQEQSRALARRLLRECGLDREAQVERAYRLALARSPGEGERRMAHAFLVAQAQLLRERPHTGEGELLPDGLHAATDPALAGALADFCLALMNRNEFLYVQ